MADKEKVNSEATISESENTNKIDNKKPVNTKLVPAFIALLAASISCVTSILQRVDFSLFTKRLVISTLVFLLLGTIIKMLLDYSFKVMEEDATVEGEENAVIDQENLENIDSDVTESE